MIIGFTGTRQPLPPKQATALRAFLGYMANITHEVHHGDCVGADELFDEIIAKHNIRRNAHPGHDKQYRSPWRADCDAEHVFPSKPYLARNKIIVDASDWIVACPSGPEVPRGSGTWATIRYARFRMKPITIVWPDGSITSEGADRCQCGSESMSKSDHADWCPYWAVERD